MLIAMTVPDLQKLSIFKSSLAKSTNRVFLISDFRNATDHVVLGIWTAMENNRRKLIGYNLLGLIVQIVANLDGRWWICHSCLSRAREKLV